MLYDKIAEQIKSIPYDCLLDVERYIQLVMYKKSCSSNRKADLSAFHGKVKFDCDPLSMQRKIRSEWD